MFKKGHERNNKVCHLTRNWKNINAIYAFLQTKHKSKVTGWMYASMKPKRQGIIFY
jgi:hypothetical protein